MCSGQPDFGGHAGIERFFPAGRAQTPAIAGLEAGKVPLGPRGNEIVAVGQRKGEEIVADFDADCVDAEVFRTGVAASIAIEASQG